MKKIITLFILIFIISSNTVYASTKTKERNYNNHYLVPYDKQYDYDAVMKTPAVISSEKIYDFADLFTYEEESEIRKIADKFVNNSNMDFVVVTVNGIDKYSLEDYAMDFYNYNYFYEDGIILVIDKGSETFCMLSFGKAEKIYTNKKINKIEKKIDNYIDNKNYYDGILKYNDIVSNYAAKGYFHLTSTEKSVLFDAIYGSLIFSIMITTIIMYILIGDNKLIKKNIC